MARPFRQGEQPGGASLQADSPAPSSERKQVNGHPSAAYRAGAPSQGQLLRTLANKGFLTRPILTHTCTIHALFGTEPLLGTRRLAVQDARHVPPLLSGQVRCLSTGSISALELIT